MLGLLERLAHTGQEGRKTGGGRSTRLSLEALESREVPAAYWWDPINGNSAATPENWRPGVSESWNRWTVPPGPLDDLYFAGRYDSDNCVIPQSLGSTFRSINLIFDYGFDLPWLPPLPDNPASYLDPRPYSGTVTLAGSFSVGTLRVDCGAIKQADPAGLNPPIPYALNAGTLTVTSSLSWTGGTLNSNDVHGNIHLAPGAIGIAEPSFTNPGINQTVGLGSTITLQGNPTTNPDEPDIEPGSSLDVLSGLYNIKNSAGFVVGSQCSLRMMPDPQDSPRGGGGGGGNQQALIADVTLSEPGTDKKGGSVTVEEGGTATYKPRARPANSTAPAKYKANSGYLVNRGGKVVIEDRTEVQLGGEYEVQGGFKWSAVTGTAWTDSKWEMQAACSILTANGTSLGAGTLKILPAIVASTGNPSMTETVAAIALLPGSTSPYALVVKGTAVVSMPQGSGAPYLTLAVGGKFGWSGGEIKLALSAGDTQCDKVYATGNIEITGTPKLSLRWIEASMLNTAVNVWELMKSEEGKITGAVNANWYDDPNTKVVMDVSISGDEKLLRAIKQPNKP